MPVVSKKEFRLPAEFGGRQVFQINFSAKTKYFSIKLPEAVAKGLRQNEVQALDITSVEKEFYLALEQFKKVKTLKREVLMLWISNFLARDEEDRKEEGHSIAFNVVQAMEYDYAGKEKKYFEIGSDPNGETDNELDARNWGSACIIVPFTPENMQKLVKAKIAFDSFAEGFLKMFGPIYEKDKGYGYPDIDDEATAKLIKKTLGLSEEKP